MLYYDGLEEILFNRYQLMNCDELVIISGYVGPTPVHRLQKLPISSTVIYGMYGNDGIQQRLHSSLMIEDTLSPKVRILYSTIPIHSKCYIWKLKGDVVHVLIGSANFSSNGLTTPYREVLAEATSDTFVPINNYLNSILSASIPCHDAKVSKNKSKLFAEIQDDPIDDYEKDVCTMPLYNVKYGKKITPKGSGINWGMSRNGNVNINDAYIKISAKMLDRYPELFPSKRKVPSASQKIAKLGHKHNDNIEILWDDGTTMTGLLEGSSKRVKNGETIVFPKQIASTPSKSELGCYLRKRLEVPTGVLVTMADLERYGRDSIDVSLQGEGIYYFDFSTSK